RIARASRAGETPAARSGAGDSDQSRRIPDVDAIRRPARNARHDIEGDVLRPKPLDFHSAPPAHPRIARSQPHDLPTVTRQHDHQVAGPVRAGGTVRDEDTLRLAAGELE